MEKTRITNRRGHVTRNPYRIEGDVAYIGLTDSWGNVKTEAIVDTQDLEKALSVGRWHSSKRSHTSYAQCGRRVGNEMRQVFLHHVLLPPDGLVIDHINGNGLDNRSGNLRRISHQQNCTNTLAAKGRSGTRNVRWINSSQKWLVSFYLDGKEARFGIFTDLEEAKRRAEEVRQSVKPLCRKV